MRYNSKIRENIGASGLVIHFTAFPNHSNSTAFTWHPTSSSALSITSLIDVSQNTELLRFRCSDNNLNCLNFANGTNSAVQEFWAHNNPNLACIQVDDSIYSAQNWNSIDSQMYFSETCSGDCNQPPLSVSHITKPD